MIRAIVSDFGGVLNHDVESIATCLFAQLGKHGDVSADKGLQSRSDRGEDISRAHDDAAHNTEVLHDAVIRQLESSGDHLMRD